MLQPIGSPTPGKRSTRVGQGRGAGAGSRRPKRRAPERTCAGCREKAGPAELVRLVLGPAESVLVDLAGGSFGRGAWIHPRNECIENAAKRGLARSFKSPVRTTSQELALQLGQAA